MVTRRASAVWEGNLKGGNGTMRLNSGAFEGQYSFASRFENGTGTNPEELVGAAHAGCFSMQLSALLAEAGYQPKRVSTTAKVSLEKEGEGFAITHIHLDTEAVVPNVDRETFMEHVQQAKQTCPVSKALESVEISVDAQLRQG